MVCKSKGNLKRPDEGGAFWKYLLWLWVWSRLTNWHSSTSDSSGMSVLITESIYWTKTSRVTTDIVGYIFNPEKICAYQVMATTCNFKFDSIKEIFDLSNGMFLTVNNIFHQSVKSSFKMNCCHRPISQTRAPPGGLSRTSGKLWQDYSNCYMFWT